MVSLANRGEGENRLGWASQCAKGFGAFRAGKTPPLCHFVSISLI